VTAKSHEPASDARALSRLTIDAIGRIVDLVEAMHYNVARIPGFSAETKSERTTGITGLVYRSIGVTVALVGHTLDRLLARLNPLLRARSAWPGREPVLAALNGVLGDYLAASGNPLALRMSLRRDGHSLPAEAPALAAALPQDCGKVLILVHGLCMSDRQWSRKGHDHGVALARELGYTPVYLNYNSGLHVSVNGRAFADQLEALLHMWPSPPTRVVILGHSMGGLVARSACHYGREARHSWVQQLDTLVFLGTPHHGAPLERGGSVVDMLLGISRYTAPLARLGKVRSAGITDLRYGNLVDEDWRGRDRFEREGDVRSRVPLPEGVRCYAIAASTGKRSGDLSERVLGDGIVPVASALGRHRKRDVALDIPESQLWIGYEMNHLDLLDRRDVYATISRWLG
jgi:pimeloyl-ACP methyl ester carboxylesterase